MFSNNSSKNQKKKYISDDIKKSACLKIKKSKSLKEKFFVLRKETSIGPARLEYYDSERKYKNGSSCKCSIILKDCFSINKKCGQKDEHLIGLYTKEDCFTILLENEAQFNDWLQALLELKTGDEAKSQISKPNYERVWQVTISKVKNERENLSPGLYRLCLTSDKKLHLIKVGSNDKNPELFELPLSCVRRLCHSKKYFNVELGRGSAIGPGNLWMMTDDNATSHDMHEAILRKMDRSSRNSESEPITRPRSSSTSENSKAIMIRHVNKDNLTTNSPVTVNTCKANSVASPNLCYTTVSIRERCDSLPSDYRNNNFGGANELKKTCPLSFNNELKPNSGINGVTSYSPPSNNPLSPSGCSTDSVGSSLSEDFDPNMKMNSADYYVAPGHLNRESAAIPSEPPIREEEVVSDDYLLMEFAPARRTSLASLISHSSTPQQQRQQQKKSTLNLKLRPSNNSASLSVASITSPLISNSHSSGKKEETEAPYLSMSPCQEWKESTQKSKRCDKSLNNNNSQSLSVKDEDSSYVPMAPISKQTASEFNLTKASNTSTSSTTTGTIAPTSNNKSPTITTSSSTVTKNLNEKDLSFKKNLTEDDHLNLFNLSSSLPQIDLGPHSKRSLLVPGPSSSLKAKLNQEFRLEKVKSYFSPSEEETSYDYIKPVRAYSMGSRPLPREGNINSKLHVLQGYPCSSKADNQLYSYSNITKCDPQTRVRSFSMDSQNLENRRLILKKKEDFKILAKK